MFVNGSVYDPKTGSLMALNHLRRVRHDVFVGTKRIEAGGSVSFTQTASYALSDLRRRPPLTSPSQLKDDKSNIVQASTLVNIQ